MVAPSASKEADIRIEDGDRASVAHGTSFGMKTSRRILCKASRNSSSISACANAEDILHVRAAREAFMGFRPKPRVLANGLRKRSLIIGNRMAHAALLVIEWKTRDSLPARSAEEYEKRAPLPPYARTRVARPKSVGRAGNRRRAPAEESRRAPHDVWAREMSCWDPVGARRSFASRSRDAPARRASVTSCGRESHPAADRRGARCPRRSSSFPNQ